MRNQKASDKSTFIPHRNSQQTRNRRKHPQSDQRDLQILLASFSLVKGQVFSFKTGSR